ncbi:MAG: hypothetical protein ABI540_02970 [Spartobacteria bacterium]
MNLPFLRYFKKDKAATTGGVAVAPPPLPPIEKPASERFGKTVMPNVSRIVGLEPMRDAGAEPGIAAPPPATSRRISLGENGPGPAVPRTLAAERTIALQLADLVPHIPEGLLQPTPIDPEQRVLFKAADLERGMAKGRPTVLLRAIFQQVPDFFLSDVAETDEREVLLPVHKVMEQFSALQVRPDQVLGEAVPEVETPFLKMTIEDGQRFGKGAAPIPPAVPTASGVPAPAPDVPVAPTVAKEVASAPTPAPTPALAPAAPSSRAPIRISLPNEATNGAAAAAAPAPIRLNPPAAIPPLAANKISPNGMGALASERVPASCGPPVPTPLPSPLAPPAPIRIPFKISPPSNDLREAAKNAPLPRVAQSFSTSGPRVRLSLGKILRALPPFQFSGALDEVPESATIEVPFSIIEPQLALGRVAISPAQFEAALPEEFRALLKLDDPDLPVALPLPEILQNLPNESLQVREDQEEAEISEMFETPFSKKAAEDAARLKSSTGPIAAGLAAAVPAAPSPVPSAIPATRAPISAAVAPVSKGKSGADMAPPAPAGPEAPPARTALQVAFDTDDTLDAKAVVAHASRLPGVSACAIVFSDGLSLAGNIPAEYGAEALCAMAPSIVKRIDDQMAGANFGPLTGVTLFCAKTPVSFFAHGNICLAALHSAGEIAAEIRARLSCAVRELARIYAQPA